MSVKRKVQNEPLTIGLIEELRRKGYNQTEIAEMHGVTRQAVSWHKVVYGGEMTPRQVVNKQWPWKTSKAHGASTAYQRLRDHGEFIATGGKGMSHDKLVRLTKWYQHLRESDLVLEFDPDLPPEPGLAPNGGFAYRKRLPSDNNLLIRVNDHTNLTPEGRVIWRFPPRMPKI